MTIRTNSMQLRAGIETTPNTNPGLTEADAVPCGKFIPEYGFEEIERLIVEEGIDAAKKMIGRETLGFNIVCEAMLSGIVGTEPKWGRLLEGCGFAKSVLAEAAIAAPIAGYDNTGLAGLAIASAGAFTGTEPRIYKIEVTKAGISATAEVSVVCVGDTTQNSTANVVTTASPINLGDEGATFTMTFASGSLVLGDKWYVYAYPPGIRYKPVAYDGDFKSVFFEHYLGGKLFKGGAARGNLSFSAPAGRIAQLSFSFQSILNDIGDADVPVSVKDTRRPDIVQRANLHVNNDNTLVVANITLETGNTLNPQLDVNAEQGIRQIKIDGRDHAFGIDPEAKRDSVFPFWTLLRERKEIPISFKVGNTPGSMLFAFIRHGVIDNPGMRDENNLLRYGMTGQCRPSSQGNDNIEFFIC